MNGTCNSDAAVLRMPVATCGRRDARVASGSISRVLTTLRATFDEWQHRTRSRRQLADLDEHLLRDIGVSRSSALFESDKFFWQR